MAKHLALAELASGGNPGPTPMAVAPPKDKGETRKPHLSIDVQDLKGLGDVEFGDTGTLKASFKVTDLGQFTEGEPVHLTLELDDLELVDRRETGKIKVDDEA